MSKKRKNYPSPVEVINDYGADALRLYLINSLVCVVRPCISRKEFIVLLVSFFNYYMLAYVSIKFYLI
ncbi:hypothetical protein Patl1_05523 [Pistacia atlantica]|uniref:Uncharacterized protein n=1 Tax=Pistacia atlantica TaxID=434234 RepID=A0ACC1BQX1_9ROSI|nr:hypothetical protein Patl1_05523 [Pistacia atlantica]